MLPAMTRFGPRRSSSLPPSQAPSVPAIARMMPKVPIGRVDAAEGEQRNQPVGIDHVGEQEEQHRSVLRQFAERASQLR
jgi:hypothetical protein